VTQLRTVSRASRISLAVALALAGQTLAFADSLTFTAGDLVVSAEGDGISGNSTYLDGQATPITLYQFSLNGASSATAAGAMMLPTVSSGANSVISGEYGSSSEGSLQLAGNGQYLTIMGYGVGTAAFNANPTAYGTSVNAPGSVALGQSGSLLNAGYITVPRVVALIGANGSVDTSTAISGIYNGNNPRSVFTQNGTSFYMSGQGNSPDSTGGVYYAVKGATTATAITGNDTNSGTSSQDTRMITVYNGQLYVSVDSKEGSGSNRDFVGTLGAAGSLPTGLANGGAGPASLSGFPNKGQLTVTAATANGVNTVGSQVNLSPENYFFANDATLYVADSGDGKQTSANSNAGDGGLQKWVNSKADGSGSWSLEYTLSTGLNLVNAHTTSAGTTGLLGLTGKVVGNDVELFATNYTVGDTDQTYLYGINDALNGTSGTGESFTMLEAAPGDTNFKGVSFAPVPLPAGLPMLLGGLAMLGFVVLRRTGATAVVG
jgi:hypothetical protein